ncbi:MAG TPA: serine/threonine-protein kinase [Caulobacteraceae bacterium]|jgi:serine/threonine-protein kinase
MAPDEDKPDDPHTVYRPPSSAHPNQPAPGAPPSPDATVYAPASAAPAPAPASPAALASVQPGAVLNGIYRVTRLIARGGMGEVFEGVNVNDEQDQVAIKVMLPSLAADPNVQAMFRKEARTLTKLSHPAVVQYRVLAQEPSLGVFYIVTEFIDGEPLSDLVGRLQPSPDQLLALIRRLAEGLRNAHQLGAVHRDISPDNILLPQGRLDQAKIIDFGIAKDLDPSKATIIGDGFAGKLGYVAPEQLGDFGRDIGPWTDVYSLGLVILTLAAGRSLDMGATLVDAVDKRRAGPDLSAAPAGVRPVLERMLAPDPSQRARSMDEVLDLLQAPMATSPEAPKPVKLSKPAKAAARPPGPGKAMRPAMALAAAAGVVVAMGVAGYWLLQKSPGRPAATSAAIAANGSNVEAARTVLNAALAGVPCSWLTLADVQPSGAGVAVHLTGVAASPQAAEAAVLKSARAAGISVPDVDSLGVQPVDAPACMPLDAFRSFRADTSAAASRLSTSQPSYTLEKQPDGTLSQKAVISMAIGDPNLDFALYGLEPSGAIDSFGVDSRKAFMALEADPRAKANIADLGGDHYRLSVITSHAGLSGLLLLTGKGPFDPGLIATPAAQRGPDWGAKIAAAAKAGGWKAEMVWYRTVGASS